MEEKLTKKKVMPCSRLSQDKKEAIKVLD